MMQIPGQRYERIKVEVANLYQDFELKPGYNPEDLAKTLGIKVTWYNKNQIAQSPLEMLYIDYSRLCAASIRKYSQGHLEYNIMIERGNTEQRQRFSFMHEIGHMMLGHLDYEYDRNLAEMEANFFAGYALAPDVQIADSFKLVTATQIADTFNVSSQCASITYNRYRHRLSIMRPWDDYDCRIHRQCRPGTPLPNFTPVDM